MLMLLSPEQLARIEKEPLSKPLKTIAWRWKKTVRNNFNKRLVHSKRNFVQFNSKSTTIKGCKAQVEAYINKAQHLIGVIINSYSILLIIMQS